MHSRLFITGKTFKEVCKYVCADLSRAEVLAVKGVRPYDHVLMAADFATQLSFLPEKEKPVFHAMLSFPHGERPEDERLVYLARAYLDEIGMGGTQHAIVKHTDKQHLHMHLIANKVDDEGKITGKGLIAERGEKAAIKLTKEEGLQPDTGKNLALTNMDALNEVDKKRYRLYKAILEDLPGAGTLEELEKRLLSRNITMRFRVDRLTGERQGVSFRIERMNFAGKKVDPSYSLRGLENTLRLQLEQKLVLGQEKRLERTMELRQEKSLERTVELRQEKRLEEKLVLEQEESLRLEKRPEKRLEKDLQQKRVPRLWMDL